MRRRECAQTQFDSHLANECGLLGHGVHAGYTNAGAANARPTGMGQHFRQGHRQGHAGKACSGAHVQNMGNRLLRRTLRRAPYRWPNKELSQGSHCRQAVQQVMRHHISRVSHRGEVVDLVPLGDEAQVGEQAITDGRRKCEPQFQERAGQQPVRVKNAQAASRVRVPPRPSKPRNRPFFRCTSNSDIAAGVTPEIREAWPKVSGRCRLSFWRTSTLSAETAA